MQQDLVATFTNGLGKTHDWKYSNLKNDLPIPVIKEACELLTTLDIFEENGVKLFDSVVTAKIVTTYETEIFDLEKDPDFGIKQVEQEKTVEKNERFAFNTPEAYEYLVDESKKSIEGRIEELTEAKKNSLLSPEPSLAIKNRSITTENSTEAASHQKSTVKNIFAWMHKRITRNKDDPDIHTRDPESP
ncbi:DUF2922 family protein [Enterococcus raffinosus]|uniref:DUF2922 family protein n=2 Tax=Enterococcus raffinosus TaxID=71452 RepID=UPI001C439D87|nr:DUF2922 family protein [Enterococcus raffinosus]QXJ59718.1 DUF2922 family protein [Enterococcus raffinosus]